MGKYLVKYACGHEQEVELFGPIKQRKWRLEQMADELCPECESKREAAELAKEAEDNELPALTGSEKQVTWAMKIRHDMLKSINELSKNVDKHECNASEHPELVDAFVERRIAALKKTMSKAAMYISEETSAAFFIDNRHKDLVVDNRICEVKLPIMLVGEYKCPLNFFAEKYDALHDAIEETSKNDADVATAKVDTTVEVQPEHIQHDTTITIKMTDADVTLHSKYDREFIDFVHKSGFDLTWTGSCWQFNVCKLLGDAASVAKEIGNALLNDGFAVVFPNREIADDATTGQFEHYHFDAILSTKDGKYLYIKYDMRNCGMKSLLSNLPKVRTNSKDSVLVPVASYKEVEEFAEDNDFFWTAGAKSLVDKYKQSIVVVSPAEITKKEAVKATRKDVDISDLNDD